MEIQLEVFEIADPRPLNVSNFTPALLASSLDHVCDESDGGVALQEALRTMALLLRHFGFTRDHVRMAVELGDLFWFNSWAMDELTDAMIELRGGDFADQWAEWGDDEIELTFPVADTEIMGPAGPQRVGRDLQLRCIALAELLAVLYSNSELNKRPVMPQHMAAARRYLVENRKDNGDYIVWDARLVYLKIAALVGTASAFVDDQDAAA